MKLALIAGAISALNAQYLFSLLLRSFVRIVKYIIKILLQVVHHFVMKFYLFK